MIKIFVKDWDSYVEIQPVTSLSFDTITDALAEAREEFRSTQSEAAAKECERLYKIKKQMDEWTS